MPPLLPQDNENILVKSPEPYYTNEDIAILHDIVVYAQDLLPSLPERERVPTNALFHAYYSILPSIGVDVDHDSRYARVLFKIGGIRSDGSLYDKFEAVLSRMGIEIQFDHENNGEDEGEDARMEPGLGQSSDPPAHPPYAPAMVDRGSSRRRANSEGPELEHGTRHQREEGSRPRTSSVSTANSIRVASLLDTISGLPHSTTQITEHIPLHRQSRDGAWDQEKGYSLRAWLSDGLGSYPQRNRTRSASMYGSMRIKQKSPPGSEYATMTPILHSPVGIESAEGSLSQFLEADVERGSNVEHLRYPKGFVTTSTDLLNTKATLLEQFLRENLQRRILSKWQPRGLQLRENNANLEILAKHQDRRVLLRQALDSWYGALEERRRRAETERFFTHLERRAGRARDLFLMAKALTHWSYSASQEIQQISVARRHILRTRYFGAWCDATAINELKVRRQILQKFFPLWQKQHAVMFVNTETAVSYFTGNLVRRYFWTWFWAFCEGRAPTWRNDKLLKKQMAIWIKLTKERNEEGMTAIYHHHRNIGRQICFAWSMKTYKYATLTRQASDYRAVSLCRKAFREWRHGSALLPRLQILRDKVALRLRRDSLNTWLLRARNEGHARAIDRLKIMREAWVTWNNKLRYQALQGQINDRLMLQGLYKWVLSERLLLARRLLEHRKMRTSIRKMVGTFHRSIVKESRDLHSAEEFFIHRLSSNAFRRWQACLQMHLRHQRLAMEFNSPIVLSGSLAIWSSRGRRIQQLQHWARNGEFYFLSSRAIESWKGATEKAKREKRRLGYAQFRRRYKLSLATRIFSRWRQQASSVTRSHQLAVDAYYNKSIVICVETFDRWRARVEEIAELDLMREQSLLKKYLRLMRLRLVSRRGLEIEAVAFFENHIIVSCLKKWSRVYLQLRARQHVGFEVREKHLKKTSRKILSHWRQSTSQKQDPVGTGNNEGSSFRFAEKTISWTGPGGDRNVDEWSDGADEATISMSIPGYLSTPSKRMSRFNPTTRLTSTTPSAPLSTPFERQLRAQYSGRVLPSFRRRMIKSLPGMEGTPLDLEEKSKALARKSALE